MHSLRELKENEVHLWTFSLVDSDALPIAPVILSGDELARSKRFVFERDRNRYVTARVKLRTLLAEYTGAAPASILFSYNEFGKPSIVGGLEFNISHSEDMMVAAVAKNFKVGVDIEKIREMSDLDGMARIVFTEVERDFLSRQSGEAKNAAFFRLWTRKEALLKAAGVGMGEGLSIASIVTGSELQPSRCTVCVKGVTWLLEDLALLGGEFAGAVCGALNERQSTISLRYLASPAA